MVLETVCLGKRAWRLHVGVVRPDRSHKPKGWESVKKGVLMSEKVLFGRNIFSEKMLTLLKFASGVVIRVWQEGVPQVL